jgi:hypothetical protein
MGAREDNQAADFVFDTMLALAGAADVFAAALLKHVRLVAPRLHVPFVTPRIEVSAMAAACGQFVEEKRAFKIVGGVDVVAVGSGLTGRGLAWCRSWRGG